MPYVIYLRKSRADLDAEARGEGETLARHERALLELAARMDIAISPDALYRELVSGDTIAARPMMQRLLAEVESAAWDGVLVMEVERLARGETIDQGIVAQAFKYSGTRILTPVKTYDPQDDMDEEYFEFSLFMSRREYKAIKRRLQAGRLASVKEGRYMGTRSVYGYERVKIARGKGYTLQAVPDKAEIVRTVFDWYAHGMPDMDARGQPIRREAGAQLIAGRLNAMGLHTDLGHAFTADGIRRMLKNPAYIGMVQWNQRQTRVAIKSGVRTITRPKSDAHMLVPGLHKSIIDRALFERVQAMFAARAKPSGNPARAERNPLSGLVKCGACGKTMVRKPDYAGRPDMLHCPSGGCLTKGVYLDTVEQALLDMLEMWIPDYAPGTERAGDGWGYAGGYGDGEYETAYGCESMRPRSAHGRETDDREAAAGHETTAKREAAESAMRRQLLTHIATLESQISRAHDLLEQGVYTAQMFSQRTAELIERLDAARSALIPLDAQTRAAADDVIAQTHTAMDDVIAHPAPPYPCVQPEPSSAAPLPRTLIDAYAAAGCAQAKNKLLKSVISKVIYHKDKRCTRWENPAEYLTLDVYPVVAHSSSTT